MCRVPRLQAASAQASAERFPGAVTTHTIEAMMQDGKALQAGTSHFLGTNFAAAAGIRLQDRDGTEKLAYTTSWGASTRLVGALIMTHADDDGLRLPPRVASAHVVIVPILRDEASRGSVLDAADKLAAQLRSGTAGGEALRVEVDLRDDAPATKRWGWIKKGVPIVVELGPRDVVGGTISFTRRDAIAEKRSLPLAEFVATAGRELEAFGETLWRQATEYRAAQTLASIGDYDTLAEQFRPEGAGGFVVGKWSGDPGIDGKLAELGLTVRCLPHEQSGTGGRCLVTGKPATLDAVYAKAY
jgi:prolyl-tRNA synthetase